MDNVNVSKKYGGSALAALLVFSIAAAVLVIPQTAYAAVTIETSTTQFYGPGFVRVLITDTSKTTATDTINPTIEARTGSTVRGSVSPTINALGTSGTFEFFITTSDTNLVPAHPTRTVSGTPTAFVVRAFPGATDGTTTNGDDTNGNTGIGANSADIGLDTGTYTMKSGDSFRVIYGGQTTAINFNRSTASLSVDRSIAGNGDEVVLTLADRDASLDPTLVNRFLANPATNTITPALSFTSTNAITYATTGDARFWQETGQNSGQFELTLVVNGDNTDTGINKLGTDTSAISLPAGNSFTTTDRDQYMDLSGTGTTTNFDLTTPSATSSASVTLQNSNSALSLLAPATLANGLQVQINDPDRNISTTGSDDVAAGTISITVEGGTNVANTVKFTETGDNTGVFLADLSNGTIPIEVGATTGFDGSKIVLSVADINDNPDITFTYTDPAVNTGSSTFKIITKLSHTSGVLEPVTPSAGIADTFAIRLTDPDLNTDHDTIQTYTMSSGTPLRNFVIGGQTVGTLELQSKGTQRDLATFGQTITFIETGPNTGIFLASNIQMSNVNAYSALSDGDQVQFTYNDLMESPAVDSDATITVGKPSTTIEADRTTVPVPTTGTTTKVTITVTDPTQNLNTGSVETISIPVTDITVTPRPGISSVGLSSFTSTGSGLNQAQTLTETGPNTGIFSKTIDLIKSGAVDNADYEGAKIKIVYGSSSTTVTLKTYDGTVTTDKSNVKNGDTVVITVTDLDMNKDPATAEQISGMFTIQGKSDDQNPPTAVTLTETGPNTGVFSKSLVVGKDFKVATLPSGTTAGTTSTSIEMKYTETIASDRNEGVEREKSISVGTATGKIEIVPSLVGPGTKFTIRVTDSDLNVNPDGVDSVASSTTAEWVKITSDASGTATKTVGLKETGANTGVFEAKVKMSPRASGAAGVFTAGDFDNDAFTALPGDIVSVKYTDQKDASGNKVIVSQTFKVTSVDPTMTAETSVSAGNIIHLSVSDSDANLDGDAQDSVRVRVTSDSDAVGFETSLLETGLNTGNFTGQIPTTTSVSAGSITVKTGDSIYLKYTDTYPADYADRVKQVVDPSKDFTYVVMVGNPAGDATTIAPSEPVAKDISGNELTEVTSGQQVILSADLQNTKDFSTPFAAIVEVRDANGFTVYLQWQTGTVAANGTVNIGLSWTPDAPGDYTVRTFALTSISNPGVLSPVAESTITVS